MSKNKCYVQAIAVLRSMIDQVAGRFFERDLLLPVLIMITSLFITLIPFAPPPAWAIPTHLNISTLEGGCSACHMGHGKSGTSMLKGKKDEFCFICHGKQGPGNLSEKNAGPDIYSEMLKPSIHPVLETAQYHMRNERMPENKGSAPRHVSCDDCHNVHQAEKSNMMKGVAGYSGRGGKGIQVRKQNDYVLCYKCHSDSANRPHDSDNISFDFDPANRSFHPVESVGRNRYVPSLKEPFTTSSLITCSDCHGNDDEFGPAGPHGSRYFPLLRFSYNRDEGAESIGRYDLCYACHDRGSILNDESFKAHKQHTVYGRVPCSGCHDAHGSRNNDALIDFDESMVFPTPMGQINYFTFAPGKPRCVLVCHIGGVDYGHEEKDGRYCVNDSCPSEW